MKRSLHIVDQLSDLPVLAPQTVLFAGRTVSVIDTGDGRAGRRFADMLLQASAPTAGTSADLKPDLRIVIRGTPQSPEARLRAEVLEETADVVLGSPRPAFARLFASACAPWANS